MKYFFYFLLLVIVKSKFMLNFDNTTVNIVNLSNATIANTTAADTCHQMIVGDFCLAHLNTESTSQNWALTNLAVSYNLNFPPSGSMDVTEFQMKKGDSRLLYLNRATSAILQYKTFECSKAPSYHTQSTYTNPLMPAQYVKGESKDYLLFHGVTDSIDRIHPSSTYSVNSINGKISVSPDRILAAVINPLDSKVYLYNMSDNFNLVHTFTPLSVVLSGVTDRVSFDSTSTFMIVQTDGFNDIMVYNITDGSTFFSFPHADTIYGVDYIQQSTDYMVIVGEGGNYFVDTRDSNIYRISSMVDANIFASTFVNKYYQCKNNIIREYAFTFTPLTTEDNFILELSYSDEQLQAAENVGNILEQIMNIMQNFTLFILSTPLAIYFIGFINFFTLSSLYILINFPIPQQIYTYLNTIFDSLNSNFLRLLGFQLQFNPLSFEKVTRTKALRFGVSSDIKVSNGQTFMVLLINFALLFIIQFIIMKLKKSSKVKKMFNQNKWGLVYGQIINLFVSFTLPWSFVLLQVGQYDFQSKLNLGLFLGALYITIHFPIIYFFLLAEEQKQQILAKREQLKVQEKKQYPIFRGNKHIKLVLTEQKKKAKPIQFEQLITTELLYEWFICLANFIYPLLVLLEEPFYFLIIITIFTLLNIIIAAKQFRKEKNNFFLTIYPFLFHICFWIFRYSSSNSVLVYSEITCLFILMVGCLHNSLTMVLTVLYYTFKSIRYLCKSNKIAQGEGQNNQIEGERKDKSVKNIIVEDLKPKKLKKEKKGNKKNKKQDKKDQPDEKNKLTLLKQKKEKLEEEKKKKNIMKKDESKRKQKSQQPPKNNKVEFQIDEKDDDELSIPPPSLRGSFSPELANNIKIKRERKPKLHTYFRHE